MVLEAAFSSWSEFNVTCNTKGIIGKDIEKSFDIKTVYANEFLIEIGRIY